jgi:hypothetical protein
MQDLSRLFGHQLDRYEVRHSPSYDLSPIDHLLFPLATSSYVTLEGVKSELVLMSEFKVISD